METHEWNENTDEGKRYFRANFQAGRWTVLTTTMKRNAIWDRIDAPEPEIWRELRDVVWKKYQRKRCPWDRVAELNRILGDDPAPEAR